VEIESRLLFSSFIKSVVWFVAVLRSYASTCHIFIFLLESHWYLGFPPSFMNVLFSVLGRRCYNHLFGSTQQPLRFTSLGTAVFLFARLRTGRPGDRGSIPSRGESLCVQTGSGAHPPSCTMGTRSPFPGAKARPERDADHSLHLGPRSRMNRSYISSPPQAPAWRSGTALASVTRIIHTHNLLSHVADTKTFV
jgi:hypothetical protein